MKYKIETRVINGYEYITACMLVSESDCIGINPMYLLDKPVEDIINDNKRLKYILLNGVITEFPQAYSEVEIATKEIVTLKAYLSSTDYIYPKCLELGLDVNAEYAEVVQKRKDARTRIQEFEALIEQS